MTSFTTHLASFFVFGSALSRSRTLQRVLIFATNCPQTENALSASTEVAWIVARNSCCRWRGLLLMALKTKNSLAKIFKGRFLSFPLGLVFVVMEMACCRFTTRLGSFSLELHPNAHREMLLGPRVLPMCPLCVAHFTCPLLPLKVHQVSLVHVSLPHPVGW